MPEIKDPVFTKTSPKCSFSMSENERFGLVFAKIGYINSGKGDFKCREVKAVLVTPAMGAWNQVVVPARQPVLARPLNSRLGSWNRFLVPYHDLSF